MCAHPVAPVGKEPCWDEEQWCFGSRAQLGAQVYPPEKEGSREQSQNARPDGSPCLSTHFLSFREAKIQLEAKVFFFVDLGSEVKVLLIPLLQTEARIRH